MSNTTVTTLDDTVFERLLRERIIVLGQEVDDAIANRIIAQLLLLAAEDPASDITLYINSPGGSVSAGSRSTTPCSASRRTWRRSRPGWPRRGQFLLTGGAPGKRGALPHAEIMMHQPHGGVGGRRATSHPHRHPPRLKQQLRVDRRHTGQPLRDCGRRRRDRWFSPTQPSSTGWWTGC